MRRRPALLLLLLLLLLPCRAAKAAVGDFLGRMVVEVHLQVGETEVTDAAVLEIVDTKVGEPLGMSRVRETLAHLFGLGRYQDIQVDAVLKGDGVVLTYRLVPLQRVRRIAFQGSIELRESELRRVVVDRYGSSPSLARAPQVVSTLQGLYRDHGYPRAQITASAEGSAGAADATLVFAVQPGPRARIGVIDVQGALLEPAPALLTKLALKSGDPYDGVAIDARLAKYADQLRTQGYYGARVAQLPRYLEQEQTVNLVVSVEPGPHVELVFQGDPLTERERDELVPVAREHSVDEDILEDSKFGIESHFQTRGYCNPRADYRRDTAGTVLTITFVITRGPQCVLQEARIVGNTSIPMEEVTPLVRSVVGEPFNENIVDGDVARIQGLYRRRGFAGVKVAKDIVRGEPRAGVTSVRVQLVITEGVRSLIQSVAFEGNSAIASDVLRPGVTSAPGQPYFEPQIASDADNVAQLYLNRGYPQVSVQPTPRAPVDPSRVDLYFVVHEGPQIFVDHVLIVGNTRTKTETIAREVQLRSGQPLSQRDEDETRSRITALGIFRRVDISYLQLPGLQTHRDVLITVDEAPVTTIDYGAGLEGGKNLVHESGDNTAVEHFELAPRGSFGISRRNLFGKDRSLSLFTRVSFLPRTDTTLSDNPAQTVANRRYGFNEYLVRAIYAERTIFNTPADATFTGGVEQTRRSSFYFNRRGVNATVVRRVRSVYTLGGRYGLDRTRVFNVSIAPKDKPLIDRLFPQVRLSTVSGSLTRDTRNDPVDANHGALMGVDSSLAARTIGSEVGFFKTFLQGFTYRPVGGSKTVAAFGARVGLATGFPRTVTAVVDGNTVTGVVDDLPASERFFAGGDATVRGFALDQLGRPDTIVNGFPQGGNGLVVLNAELRTPLLGGLGAVGFVDVGNVFLHASDIRLGLLRAAVGAGLRYRSPIGPIRVDLGVKLDRQTLPDGSMEHPTALHISLGQAF